MQKFSIKDIRRIEQEVDNEIVYVEQNSYHIRENQQATKEAALEAGITDVQAMQDKAYELIELRFKIRDIVAAFNKDNGINERTAKIALLEQKQSFLDEKIAGFGRVGTTRDYNSQQTKYTPGVDTEFVDAKRVESRDIKRQIQRLKDSCNGINSNAKFDVEPELVALFTKYGFIDKQA